MTWRRTVQHLAAILVLGVLGACRSETDVPVIYAAPDGTTSRAIAGATPERGAAAMRRYGCGSCHVVPGVAGATGLVGPPLTGFAGRTYIAGLLPNEPEHLVRWIRAPQAIAPGTAMPNLGVTENEARDMAAYLYTLNELPASGVRRLLPDWLRRAW